MTTGAQLYGFIKNGIDQEYSGYLSVGDANRLVKEGIYRVSENLYMKNKTQKTSDELSPLTVLDREINIRNNSFYTSPIRITGATFVGATVTLTTETIHQLLPGESFTISNVQGLNINGTYTVVSVTGSTQFTFTEPAVAGVYVAGTGGLTTAFMFGDMMHPLAIQTTFPYDNYFSNYSIDVVTTTATPYIGFTTQNIIRTGSKVRISGALGVAGLIGDFYVKFRNRRSVHLFTDKALTTPPVLSGTYQGGGVAKVIVSEYATKMHPDRKIALSSNGDVWTPKFGVSENKVILYPSDANCERVKVDYTRRSPIEIDVLNTSIDLELYFNFKFLMKVKDDCVAQFAIRMRELPQAQAEIANAAMNP